MSPPVVDLPAFLASRAASQSLRKDLDPPGAAAGGTGGAGADVGAAGAALGVPRIRLRAPAARGLSNRPIASQKRSTRSRCVRWVTISRFLPARFTGTSASRSLESMRTENGVGATLPAVRMVTEPRFGRVANAEGGRTPPKRA